MSSKKNKIFIYSPIVDTIDLFLLPSLIPLKNDYEIIYISNFNSNLGYTKEYNNYPIIETKANNQKPLSLLNDIRLILKYRSNSIFIFNGSTTIILSFLLKLLSYKTKNIYILHGTLHSKGKFLNSIFITILFFSNLFGVEINSVNKSFLRFCFNRKRFKFIGVAGVGISEKNIDLIKIRRKNYKKYKSSCTIAYIGRHEISKGIDLFDKISEINDNPNFKFISIGGYYYPKSHKPKFYQFGPLSREELFSKYQDIDILILPSKSEGLGMVMVECCIAGIPTIASRTDGSLQFLNKDIGIIINKPNEILYLNSIKEVTSNLEYFSNNCIFYSENNNNFISKPFLNI